MNKKERDKIIDDLKADYPIHEEVKFSDIDINEKLKINPFMVVKYQELFIKSEAEYNILMDLYDKWVSERQKHYKFEAQEEWGTKTEIEKYALPADKRVIKMKKILRKQELRMNFFKICAKAHNDAGWRMKEWISNNRFGN